MGFNKVHGSMQIYYDMEVLPYAMADAYKKYLKKRNLLDRIRNWPNTWSEPVPGVSGD